MNELKNFAHPIFGELPVMIVEGIEWFGASEAARALSFAKPHGAIENHVDEDDSLVQGVTDRLGRKQQKKFINESGLYSLIFGAAKQGNNPEIKAKAKQFKRWVTSEVLPSIRKHGAYMTPNTIENVLNDPDFGIQLLTTLKEERSKRELAELQRNQVIAQQKEDLPYTNFGKIVSNSTGAINVGAFAKMMYDKHGLKIGRNKMFKWLRDKGYLIKQGREYNNPKQIYIEQGLFDVTPTMVSRTEGDIEKLTTLITGKGQIKLTDILLKEFTEVAQ